jgi:energy-coupling factor transport system substrate-specific component
MIARRVFGSLIYLLSSAIGVLAFAYPFFTFTGPASASGATAHGQDAPLVTAGLVGISLLALLLELHGQAISAKLVATLGVLVAIISVLRFIEVVIPAPGGFSPIFAPVILAGYVFGGRFGFLLGAFTLLVSGLITGGIGPWLPYQMFATGWVGLTAGWLRPLARLLKPARLEIVVLCVFGFGWGLLYGAIMNLYFWPFVSGPVDQSWASGSGIGSALQRYALFYVTTSLGWDLARSVGNVAFILLLGRPLVSAFARFQRRLHFEARSSVEVSAAASPGAPGRGAPGVVVGS